MQPLLVLKFVGLELLRTIYGAPIWWYTDGLKMMAEWAQSSIAGYAQSLSLKVWIKNIFVPMYGQYDWQSRLISFFMRSVQIVFRGLALALWVTLVIVASLLYLFLAPAVIIFTVFQGLGLVLS